jgi:hypothetical protein
VIEKPEMDKPKALKGKAHHHTHRLILADIVNEDNFRYLFLWNICVSFSSVSAAL